MSAVPSTTLFSSTNIHNPGCSHQLQLHQDSTALAITYKNSPDQTRTINHISLTMAQFDSKPVTQQEPCNLCSASMEALNILAMSLHMALQGKPTCNIIVHELSCCIPAAQYIHIPLPRNSHCYSIQHHPDCFHRRTSAAIP